MKLAALALALLAGALLPGCLGRQEDDTKPAPAAGPTREVGASLLSFGAVWCKPCRKEIDDLNALAKRTSGKLQVRGYLVEDSKGKAATWEDVPKFVSPKGTVPAYEMVIDTDWKVLDSFSPLEGRALPLLVLVNPDGTVHRQLQGLTSFQGEVVPVVDAWLAELATSRPPVAPAPDAPRDAGNSTGPVTPGEPKPPAPEARSLNVGSWLAQPALHSVPAAEVVFSNMRASWEKGLAAAGFTRIDMPFEAGTVDLKKTIPTPPAGVENWTVSEGRWNSESNCTLTVRVTVDGAYVSSKGICR